MPKKSEIPDASAELRRSAEILLLGGRKGRGAKGEDRESEPTSVVAASELRHTRLELEMQNFAGASRKPGIGWRACWVNTPTSTILRR